MKTILIAGGTGFVGKSLIEHLSNRGYVLNVLTRKSNLIQAKNVRYFRWDVEKGYIDREAFEGVTKIVNLTGAGITEKRWTRERKLEIVESRVKAIDLLYKYVDTLDTKIETFISSSATGYYGAVTSNEIFTEASVNGSDFLAFVCDQWEKAASQFENIGITTVLLRKGVVIGHEGGMYQKLAPLAKLGINVSLGDGKHYLPWIDIRDLAHLYEFVLQHDELEGIFNAVSSQHITMNNFSDALLRFFGKSNFLPNAPAFIIKLLFGEMAAALLAGSRVSNAKLKNAGFKFAYDTIEIALQSTPR